MVARFTMLVAVLVAIGFVSIAPESGRGGTVPIPDTNVGGGSTSGFLSECASLPDKQLVRCYRAGLLAAVEERGDPATGVPEIDQEVHRVGGFLEAACHSLMHDVGRAWARRHGVTIETLYRYVPRSNDPGCSGGFGMGMAMYLGPKLILEPRTALAICDQLDTRFREYTCVHGSGHAFMRGFHGSLAPSIAACKKLGPANAPDCSQGAFHDYWISLGSNDGAQPADSLGSSPETVCGAFEFKRPCWYRYFWERQSATRVRQPEDILGLCDDYDGLQRAGCVGGASLLASRELLPVEHATMCHGLSGVDTYNCLRGVNVPALDGMWFEQVRLVQSCDELPAETRTWCTAWFGRTLGVLTNGGFRTHGCEQLTPDSAAISCRAGAARLGQPLRTFA